MSAGSLAGRTPTEELTWRVHLARRQPGRALGAVAAALGAGAWAYLLFGSLLAAAAATALILGAVGEFLLPITYRLTAEGAEARGGLLWRRIAWREVRHVYPSEETIKLSPLPPGSRREAFRGVLLRCDGNHEAVLAAIERQRLRRVLGARCSVLGRATATSKAGVSAPLTCSAEHRAPSTQHGGEGALFGRAPSTEHPARERSDHVAADRE